MSRIHNCFRRKHALGKKNHGKVKNVRLLKKEIKNFIQVFGNFQKEQKRIHLICFKKH